MINRQSVLRKHPTSFLGLRLTPTQQVVSCFLVPTLCSCIIYMVDIASTIAVIERHFSEGNVTWAVLSLLVIYTPSYVYFTLTVSNLENWDEQCEKSHATIWMLTRILHLVLFPVWGVYRYSKTLFWSIEALAREGSQREDALAIASQPSQIELYLFLQAFIQGIPQALLQTFILFTEHDDTRETDSLQVVCIASSLILVAGTTVSFHRFESHKNIRQKPWTYIPENKKIKPARQVRETTGNINTNNEETKETMKSDSVNSDEEISTPYLQPRVISNDSEIHTSEAQITIPQIPTHTPPSPPRPFSTIDDRVSDYHATRAQPDLEQHENVTPVPEIKEDKPYVPKVLVLPRRLKMVETLERDELLGKFTLFLVWFFFILCRTLALVSFTYFFMWVGICAFLLHYTCIAVYLLLYNKCKSLNKIVYQLCLAYVFSFCLIEVKIKFKRAYLIYTVFFVVTNVENLILSSAWYLFAEWEGWWYRYAYYIICGSWIISALSIFLYIHIFKPTVQIKFEDESTA